MAISHTGFVGHKASLRALAIALILGVSLQGCIVHRIMDSEDREQYSAYRMESERINLEREKAGLPPQEIQTFDEWRGADED